jgi:hypothetical protein
MKRSVSAYNRVGTQVFGKYNWAAGQTDDMWCRWQFVHYKMQIRYVQHHPGGGLGEEVVPYRRAGTVQQTAA